MPLISKKIVLLCLVVLVLGIAATAGFFTWRTHVISSQEKRSYQTARDLLKQSRGNEALSVIRTMKGISSPDNLAKWVPLEIQALEQTRNTIRLLYLYGQNPGEVLKQEKASLLVARTLLEMKKTDVFTQVRDAWKDHEEHPQLWFALDVDALLLQGRHEEALALLTSRSFQGAADCGRLIRLAMLRSARDIDEAWTLLDQAFRTDPRNPDVRSFRAQILESRGRMPLARVEYVSALLCDPGNPLLRDQLAEFYRRQGNFLLALKTWTEGLSTSSMDYFWIKALFWNKVAFPYPLPADKTGTLDSELAPLVKKLQCQKQGTFWAESSLHDEADLKKLMETRQEIFWLRLIQALKDGSEIKAMEMLKTSPYKASSFSPQLERALRIILIYRKWGVIVDPESKKETVPASGNAAHQFFNSLENLTRSNAAVSDIPPDLDILLKSRDVFSAAFLAAGWLETAIALNTGSVIPGSYPDWFAYGMTQAFRYTRGNKAALDFAAKQKSATSLDMLAAEILLADDQYNRALPRLKLLAANSDPDIAFRAAWFMSIAYLNKGRLNEAANTVSESKALSSSVAGKEILARVAVNQGNAGEAARLYGMIADESLEAKTYLARRAFSLKDWRTARKYTQELIEYLPDMMELRDNLEKISQEEKNVRP